MRKRYRIGLLSVSLIVLAAIIWYANPVQMAQTLAGADLWLIVFALVIASANMIVRTVKWRVLLDGVSTKDLIPIQLLGLTISNFTPGKIGEPIKSIVLKMRSKISVSVSLPSVIWERIIDVVILILFSLIAIQLLSLESSFYYLGFISIGLFIAIIVVFIGILSFRKAGFFALRIAKKLPVLKRISKEFVETFYKTKSKKSGLIYCFFLTLLAWVVDGYVFHLAFLSIGINIDPITMVAILSLSTLIGVVSFLPGGLGTTEVVMAVLFSLLGVASNIAITGIILARLLTFWYSVLLGGFSFMYLGRKIEMKNILE